MKKQILISTLLATLLTACGQNSVNGNVSKIQSEQITSAAVRTFHCSLLVDGQAFGRQPARQLGFDVQEGQAVTLDDGWRVSIYITGDSFASGTMLFASVTRTARSRNVLTVVSEPRSSVIGGSANVWADDLDPGVGSASVYLTCSADTARGISPDRP